MPMTNPATILFLALLGSAAAFTVPFVAHRSSLIVAVESAPPPGFVWADGLDSYVCAASRSIDIYIFAFLCGCCIAAVVLC